MAVLLFLLTVACTTTLGPAMILSASPSGTELEPLLKPHLIAAVWSDPRLLAMGLAFSLSALTILFAHEMGHYVACRLYRLPCTLPYFLPVPFNFGTFGAFIRIKSPIRSRRELFDVGVAGPIAGFVALLPFLLYGVAHSRFVPAVGGGAVYRLGSPLALELASRWLHGAPPPGMVLALHPFVAGAWLGLLATAFNLLPLGQLDGGHILYAAIGRRQRRLAPPLLVLLALLGLKWHGWWVWCIVLLVLGPFHPPVRDESEALDIRRWALALLALVLLALSFSPVPIDLAPGALGG